MLDLLWRIIAPRRPVLYFNHGREYQGRRPNILPISEHIKELERKADILRTAQYRFPLDSPMYNLWKGKADSLLRRRNFIIQSTMEP